MTSSLMKTSALMYVSTQETGNRIKYEIVDDEYPQKLRFADDSLIK